jgi:alkanesulfonate monooxygenase SsuD/methylene tetrahydromethanopterin reductase-like flavin-dependent oxidoreductase (luciferase family)
MVDRPAPQFGISLFPSVQNIESFFELAQMADEGGLDFIGAQDHPYNADFLDTWSFLTLVAARTKNIRILPNVLNIPLRPPVMLAKSAATIDVATGGRVELGIGSGAFAQGAHAFGGPVRSGGEAVDALEEAVQVMKGFWQAANGGRAVNFPGKYYQLNRAQPGPVPAHQIGIWIGSYGPRMLKLTGRLGDGWLPSSAYLPSEQLLPAQALIDEGAKKAGRDVNAINRGYNVMGVILPKNSAPMRSRQPGMFAGSTQYWIDEIKRHHDELRIDTFIYWPSGEEGAQVRRFIEEVVPAVKEALA